MTRHDQEKDFLPSVCRFFLLGSIFAFLFYAPWFYGLTSFRDQLIAQLVVFSLFLLSIPLIEIKQVTGFNLASIDSWVLLSIGLCFLYVLVSVLPYVSLLVFMRFLAAGVFYCLIRNVVRTDNTFQLFLWAMLVIGFFYSVYGLFQYYGSLPHAFWYLPNCLASRYVNGGHFAAFLLFPICFGLSLLMINRNIVIRLTILVCLLPICWALVLTRSRTVWITFVIGIMVFIWLAIRHSFINRKMVSGMILFGTLLGVLLIMRGGFHEILARMQELSDNKFYSLTHRWHFWQGSLRAIVNRPWGWGLGTFRFIFPQFRVYDDRFLVDYAHNEFLQVGVDLGIAGIAFLIGFFFFYLRKALAFLKNEAADTNRKTVAASFASLAISLFLTIQFDFPLRIYSISLVFAMFLALSANLFQFSQSEKEILPSRKTILVPHRGEKVIRLFFFAIFFGLVFLTARQLLAEIHFENGKHLEKDFRWKESKAQYAKAIWFSPIYGNYYEALGDLYRKTMALSLQPRQKKKILEDAIQLYEKAIKLNSYNPINHYFLALLYEENGLIEKAKSEFQKAISKDPMNAFFFLEYGYFALRHSHVEEAIATFEKFKSFQFREGEEAKICVVLRKCSQLTKNYGDLKRIVLDDDWQGHHCLGLILGESGQWEFSKVELNRAMEQAKKIYKYDHFLEHVGTPIANFYISHDHFQEALDIYQEAVAKNPEDSKSREKVGDLYEKMGQAKTLGLPQ